MEKILLNEGREQCIAFQQSVQDVVQRSNELISLWHRFQEWGTIETTEDFIELVKDPIGRLDKLLINAVDIKVVGKKTKLNPEAISGMLNIDYQSWVNIIEGREPKTDCIACRGVRMRRGVKAITLPEFWLYSNFLTFEKGRFVAINEAVKEHQKTFQVFTASPQQNELHEFWENACNVLNELRSKGYLGNTMMVAIQKELNGMLMFSYETNKFHLSAEMLANTILKVH
jgi:hypothetical protein